MPDLLVGRMLPRMSDDPITRLNAALEGRYTIERELGEGGMATVYLADGKTVGVPPEWRSLTRVYDISEASHANQSIARRKICYRPVP